ncbi:hypothetical protein [Actinocrispum wychmicini]|uniref:NACHT domain-containing protein n=1 Tax=Actinocrispum wychmicini TaxID=1213861 RepID=A0A4R2JH61_9PSEU|nr:hypothetical protein [Actinocrispum wychmicini]TCO55719.1 hypothetical protein EV192_107141 [Actinocrispum wychmicini]
MDSADVARHHTIVVLDVEGFGDRRRTNPHQRGVRDGLYHIVRTAFDTVGVPWADCYHEDRGDAVFVLAPASTSKALFVETLPPTLITALRVHNDTHADAQRIRLRMAVHAGEVHYDDHGVTSSSLTLAFRLIDAQPLKAALRASPGVLAVITSDWFFDDVVRHTPGAAPATYRPVPVSAKETNTVGWITLPDHPYPPDVAPPPDVPAVVSANSRPQLSPPVDERLRLLARASWNQWTVAANDRRLLHPAPLPIRWCRSMAPVAGPVSATEYARFDPLAGLTAVSGSDLCEGGRRALHQVYGGLPSGRVLLVGPPGSGKSAAAILLLLDALRYREQATPEDQARIPVPVLFTLHGWDPDHGESVTDWMAGKLAETYPLFRSRAGRHAAIDLLTAGHVAGFLDGLDEIPESVRPGVLAALADAPFRLVLLTRTAEAVVASHHGPLPGAVALELQPVTPTDAANYLLQPLVDPPPTPWQTIRDHLAGATDHTRPRRISPLSEALTTPLALSLLRDVYSPTDPVDELLDSSRFRTADDIENHLLDHAITAAYTPRPGHPTPRYTMATAHRTLRYLATRLTEHHTADLAWWHIPTWTPRRSRTIAGIVATVLWNELIWAPGLGLSYGLGVGLLAGLTFGLLTIFAVSTKHFRGVPVMPRRITRLTYRNASHSLVFGLVAALMGGLLSGFSAGLVSGLSVGLVSGLAVGLSSGLAGVALFGLAGPMEVDDSSLGPADVWRHDRNAGLVFLTMSGLVIGFQAALAIRLVPGLASALTSRLSVVLPVTLLVGLVLGFGATVIAKRVGTPANAPGAATLDTAAALVQLAVRHKIPLRLIPFLEDARSRHLLRTVGPVYQFRHATLQHRLAQRTPERSSGVVAAR